MRRVQKLALGLSIIILSGAALFALSAPSQAAINFNSSGILGNLGTGKNNLSDLFVLDSLFSNNNGLWGNGLLGNNNNNLGNLFVLDQLFGGKGAGLFSGGTSGGTSNLGDLILLNQLFGNRGIFDNNNLGQLYLYNKLLNNSSTIMNGLNQSSSTDNRSMMQNQQ